MTKYSEQKNKGKQDMSIIVTPKYHPEIAGEGIEYCWGMAKKWYRNIPLEENMTKEKFHESVKSSINQVEVKHARKFSGRARQYMIAYRTIKKKNLHI